MISWPSSARTLEKKIKQFEKNLFLRPILALSIPFFALIFQWFSLDVIRPFIWFAFFPAVFLSSWIGGLLCGLSATVLSVVIVWLFFIPYTGFVPGEASRYILMSLVFFSTGVLFSILHHRLRKLIRFQEKTEIEHLRHDILLNEAQRIGKFGSWAWDVKHNRVQWSDELYRILGLEPQRIKPTSQTFFEYVHPEDRENLMKVTEEVLRTKKSSPMDFRVILPDGKFKIVHGVGEVYHNEEGEVTEMVGTVHDITERKLIEDAYRESEMKFRGLLEMANDPVVIIDANGKIEFVNRQVKNTFGYQDEELLDQSIENLIPERHRLFHLGQRSEYLKNPEKKPLGKYLQLLGKRKDGTEFPLDISLSPFKTKRGWIITAFMRDISDKKRSEAQQKFISDTGRILNETIDYQECIQRIADIVVPRLADACLVHVAEGNSLRMKAFAHSKNIKLEIIENAFSQISLEQENLMWGPGFVAKSYAAQLIEVVDETFLRSIVAHEESLFKELSSLGIRSWISVPMTVSGRNVGIISFIRCASKKYTPTDLNMSQLVADRAAVAVDHARLYHEAQVAIRLREDMLAIVSHDLKNPLGVIKGYNEHIYEILRRSEFDKGTLTSTKAISRSVKHMDRLICDLLDFAKIQSGTFSLQYSANCVEDIAGDGITIVRHLADQKEIKIETKIEANLPIVNGDRGRICQVLSNLIGNAIKFSPEQSRIEVGAKLIGSAIQFTVNDMGKGISPESIPHLFDRYWQEKETASLGTGLGLSIAKGIVESHKGRIWVESQIGQGSTFYFTIPLQKNAPQPGDRKPTQALQPISPT